MKVKILSDGITAKEVNEKTNRMMGIRHQNYEKLLRAFEIDFSQLQEAFEELEKQVGGSITHVNLGFEVGEIREAILLDNGKIRIV